MVLITTWDTVQGGTRGTAAGWPRTRAAFYLSTARATANAESRGGQGRALRLKLLASLPSGDVKEEL